MNVWINTKQNNKKTRFEEKRKTDRVSFCFLFIYIWANLKKEYEQNQLNMAPSNDERRLALWKPYWKRIKYKIFQEASDDSEKKQQ